MRRVMIRCDRVSKTYRFSSAKTRSFLALIVNTFRARHIVINALRDVSFDVHENEIFGLLGRNGSGKTTILRILSGMSRPTRGAAFIDGLNVVENAQSLSGRIGLVLGPSSLYHRITGYQNLKYYALLYGVAGYGQRIDDVAQLLGISGFLDAYVERYSTGMKMKLSIARALLHDPEILLLDEPTSGLDPIFKAQIRDIIRKLKRTVVIATHDLAEAEALCDRVAFLNEGRIVRVASVQELMEESGTESVYYIRVRGSREELALELSGQTYVRAVVRGNPHTLMVRVAKDSTRDLLSLVSNYDVVSIRREESGLSGAFQRSVGGEQ